MREHRLIHLKESPLKTTLRVCMSVLVGGLRKEGRKEGRDKERLKNFGGEMTRKLDFRISL